MYDDFKDINKGEARLGFILIRKNETSGGSDFNKVLEHKYKERKDIIWSKPFKIIK
jgi:hypothetical protein